MEFFDFYIMLDSFCPKLYEIQDQRQQSKSGV